MPRPKCGSLGDFGNVAVGGLTYDLNVVSKFDSKCGGKRCLLDYLEATHWTPVRCDAKLREFLCFVLMFITCLYFHVPCGHHTSLSGTRASSVTAGVVCAVTGSDGPYTHVVIGVGNNLCAAHNMAHEAVKCDAFWTFNQCVHPPA